MLIPFPNNRRVWPANRADGASDRLPHRLSTRPKRAPAAALSGRALGGRTYWDQGAPAGPKAGTITHTSRLFRTLAADPIHADWQVICGRGLRSRMSLKIVVSPVRFGPSPSITAAHRVAAMACCAARSPTSMRSLVSRVWGPHARNAAGANAASLGTPPLPVTEADDLRLAGLQVRPLDLPVGRVDDPPVAAADGEPHLRARASGVDARATSRAPCSCRARLSGRRAGTPTATHRRRRAR